MNPFFELTARDKLIEVLRWLGVLPAAFLGDTAVQFLFGGVVQLAGIGVGGPLGDLGFAHALRVFLYYVPHKAVFVVAGAKIAPRYQWRTAIGLAGLGLLLSLMTHVVGQYVRGNSLGSTNYIHLLAETAGLVAGAAYIYWQGAARDLRTG